MILYHGSNISIDKIDLGKCRPYKDFGKGFYLTEIKEQAIKMANRVAKIYGGTPVVNIYELSDFVIRNEELNIYDFGTEPTVQWASFVMNNRNCSFTQFASNECNLDNKYDIVIGPVADDDMAMLFRQYQNKWIDFSVLLKGLTFKSTTNQYSFHTIKSLEYIQKVGVCNE